MYTDYIEASRQLNELLEQHNYRELRNQLPELPSSDIAAYMDEIGPEDSAIVFRLLPKELSIEVFSDLSQDLQESLIKSYSDSDLKGLLDGLFMDDFADLLDELPATVAKRVLQNTSPDKRREVNRLLQYPEDSAGSIMTTEYLHLKKDMTVAEAIARLRSSGDRHVTIYLAYVTTDTRILEGIISVREILNGKDEQKIEDLMETNIVAVQTTEDQETVARMFDKYDFLALPVVDHEHRLVGIVTIDDAVDVLTEEAQEDMSIMAAVNPSEKPYLQSSVFEHARRRLVWLLLLMISGMINGGILQHYESAFTALPILVTFIPMLTDTGGNAGSQSSSMMIQDLANGELQMKDWLTVLWKELRISLLISVVLSVINFLRLYYLTPANLVVSLAVSTALIFIVIMAKLVGCMLPFLAKVIKVDPAIMAAPLITTIVDALGLIIYFGVAEALVLHF